MDPETVRAMLLRNLGGAADDPVGSHDMYDDDAVLEFPQSGERFEGCCQHPKVAQPLSGIGEL
jgi:hypothetical protein